MSRRRGFTLVELLVTVVVMGILGTALARLMISNSRFVSRQSAMLDARQTARAAMTILGTDLRMVTDSGLLAASKDSVTIRVPYAFGLLCEMTGSTTYGSLAPVDSAMYAGAIMAGVAWRGVSGAYVFRSGQSAWDVPSATAKCTVDSIRVVSGSSASTSGRVVGISGGYMADPGTVFYLYQVITYRFKASAIYPGRVGLWRTPRGGTAQEVLAPFDTSAGFRFMVGASQTAQAAPPAALTSVAGLELRLDAQSVDIPNGSLKPLTYQLRTRTRFLNR